MRRRTFCDTLNAIAELLPVRAYMEEKDAI
jgi:hypothetical protein